VVMAEVWTPTLERRRAAWFQQLSDDVEALAGEIGDLEHLLGDDAVFDVALNAAQVAMRTRSEHKHKALRAAVLNSAIGGDEDEDRLDVFLVHVDRLTEAHLRMLAFYARPGDFTRRAGLSDAYVHDHQARLHQDVFPEWPAEFCDVLSADLDSMGFVKREGAAGAEFDPERRLRRITGFGRHFIAFITHPLDAGDDS
jgi:hypothetical protein